MGVWEALELLNEVVDDSDPDTSWPQIVHALQTAEAIRQAHPGPEHEWFVLTGLIHDLGKVLAHPRFGGACPGEVGLLMVARAGGVGSDWRHACRWM